MTPPERLLESLSVISNGCGGGAVQKTGDASLLYLGVFCECEMTTTRPYLQGDPGQFPELVLLIALYSVDIVDVALDMEQWAERAAQASVAHSACFYISCVSTL